MNEWPNDIKSFLWWLATGAMSFVTWLGYRQLKRLDRLEANYVSKADLEERLDEMKSRQEARHTENIERFDDIKSIATSTHQRIDDLYRDLMQDRDR